MPPPYNPMKDFNFRSGLLSGRPPLPAGPLLGGLPEVPGMTSTPPPPAMPPPTTPRERELAARQATNASHSASVDATEQAWAARPAIGSNSLLARASARDGAVRTGSLSERGAVPVGKRMTPQRRLEMFARRAWTRGDERTSTALAQNQAQMDQQRQQQQSYQDFGREQNAVNFQQGLFMNDVQQRGQAARDAQQRQEHFENWQRDQAAQAARDAQQFQNQMTLHGLGVGERAMEAERERKQQEAERGRVPFVGTIPVPGTDYVMPHADGRVMGTLPTARKEAPLPPGMVPMQAERNGVQYGLPGDPKPNVPTVKEFKNAVGVSEYRQWNTERGGWEKVKFIDADGDGIDDRQQVGGGDHGSLSTRPAQKTGTSKFGNEINRLMGGVK